MEERSPFDPRPATARPVGTVDRVVADDGATEIWHLVKVETPTTRRAALKEELVTLEADDFDEMKRIKDARIAEIKKELGR